MYSDYLKKYNENNQENLQILYGNEPKNQAQNTKNPNENYYQSNINYDSEINSPKNEKINDYVNKNNERQIQRREIDRRLIQSTDLTRSYRNNRERPVRTGRYEDSQRGRNITSNNSLVIQKEPMEHKRPNNNIRKPENYSEFDNDKSDISYNEGYEDVYKDQKKNSGKYNEYKNRINDIKGRLDHLVIDRASKDYEQNTRESYIDSNTDNNINIIESFQTNNYANNKRVSKEPVSTSLHKGFGLQHSKEPMMKSNSNYVLPNLFEMRNKHKQGNYCESELIDNRNEKSG